MAIYLNEDQLGWDAGLVGFPHLLVCMGLVAITDALLYAAHLTDVGGASDNVVGALSGIIDAHANRGNLRALYGSCNRNIRYEGAHDRLGAWRNEMRAHAAALGYQGRIRGFCTSILNPLQGTYVEYLPNYPARKCRVYYKRNEKMDFIDGPGLPGGGPVQKYSQNLHRLVGINMAAHTTGAGVQRTSGNRGQLHEVNYVLRMDKFTV